MRGQGVRCKAIFSVCSDHVSIFLRIDFGIFNLRMIFMGVLPVCMQCPQKPRAASVFNPSAISLAL